MGASAVVEGIDRYLALYVETARKLTVILDHENQQLLFESGEAQILRDAGRQEAKQALYGRVETLARIMSRTLEVGTPEEIAAIHAVLGAVDSFRRSLRLNSALLEVCIERQEKRMETMTHVINSSDSNTGGGNVTERSI